MSAVFQQEGEKDAVVAEAAVAPAVAGADAGERAEGTRPDAAQEARFERLKRLRNRRAEDLGLQPGVVCPNGALALIARNLRADKSFTEAGVDTGPGSS